MVKHVTSLKLQVNTSLKYGHVSEACSANTLDTYGGDRMIKKLLFRNWPDMSNRDEALTCLHTQLVWEH